jgi:hypothetical protein
VTPSGLRAYGARYKTLARFVEPAASNQINTANTNMKKPPQGRLLHIWWAVLDSNQRPIG